MVTKTVSEDGASADWTKKTWDLPPYKSPDFMRLFPDLTEFRTFPAYKFAVQEGLITNDQWTGPVSEEQEQDAFAEEFQAALVAAAMEEDDETTYNAQEDIDADGQ